jgi:Tfp pilus assembly protein PilO
MSGTVSGTASGGSSKALLRRIAQEHRRVLVPLLVALAANVLVYAFIVYPMSQRVANIEESSRLAAAELAAAKGEYAQANGTLTGKDRAAKELSTFYSTILPRGLTGARRLTTLRLQQMARQSNLDMGRQAAQEVTATGSTLKQLRLQMDLAGTYADMRAFIHELEIAPEFVVIDNVSLAEGADDGGTIVLNLEFSTYYRDDPQ